LIHREDSLPTIDAALVRRLIDIQFPQWSGLPVTPIVPGGWDNRSFRLGDDKVVRLPSNGAYSSHPEKEHRWLSRLAPSLPCPIPIPVALGEPARDYPWRWVIHRWVQGEVAAPTEIAESRPFADDLADFLLALQRIESAGGPPPGVKNFHRGGHLSNYDGELREAIRLLGPRIDGSMITRHWEAALDSEWSHPPVWTHGDIAIGGFRWMQRRGAAHAPGRCGRESSSPRDARRQARPSGRIRGA